jgi:hypothetical protein
MSRGLEGAGEYAKHFAALGKLSVAVAEAMPKEQYAFRPHPDSMSFGDLMVHIASTNYQFCAGLKDADTPPLPSPKDKDGIVKMLSGSFAYCSPIIAAASDEQMEKAAELHDLKRARHAASLTLSSGDGAVSLFGTTRKGDAPPETR